MKLRRLKILGVMLLIGISAMILEATVRSGTYSRVRPAGSATSSSGNLNFAVDSGQTLWVDTFYSDTVLIDSGSSWVHVLYYPQNPVLPDSGYDSMNVRIYAYISYGTVSTTKRLLDSDTIVEADTNWVGDTIWNRHNWDTLSGAFTRLWFETVVSESITPNDTFYVDTGQVKLLYEVLQK